jgi:hypothetical protein
MDAVPMLPREKQAGKTTEEKEVCWVSFVARREGLQSQEVSARAEAA